jgi:hypothetical protein
MWLQRAERIDRRAVPADFKVKVRPGRKPGHADTGDNLSL